MQVNLVEKFNNRVGLVVWLRNFNDQKKLFQYGNVVHASKELKYVYLYVPKEKVHDIRHSLQRAHFVRRIQSSNVLKLDFDLAHEKELMEQVKLEAQQHNEAERGKH